MAFIVEPYVGDRAIQIGVEEVMRKLSFGTNWQRIRFGITCAYAGGTTALPASFNGPVMGLCTGYGSGRLCLSSTDCIFANFAGGSAMSYAGTTPNFYYDMGATTTIYAYQRVATTQSNGSSWTSARSCISANPTALRSFFAIDITKGTAPGASYTLNMYSQSNAQITTDFNRQAFIAAMTTDGTPTNTTNVSTASGYCALRTTKDWDTVYLQNVHSVPALTIFNMAVTRIS
jgi:hypothetical protein